MRLGFDYPVVFEKDSLRPESTALAWAISREEPGKVHRVLAVVDGGLLDAQPDFAHRLTAYFRAHAARMTLASEVLSLPGGEQVKSDRRVIDDLHERMLAERLDRHSVVLVCGGGAVLDAAGYAVATFHRGLRLVRMPTTLLAQNDAGIGVKNGINAHGVKNLLGTFAPPYAVLNDAALLATLSDRDVRSGLAEAVKVALIRDAGFFDWLSQNRRALASRDAAALEVAVARAARLHLEHIAQGGDPFETGSARPLDFGHWAAHRLEVQSGHALRHGEAVAIGIAIDSLYSSEIGLLPRADAEVIAGLLRDLGFELAPACLLQRESDRLQVLRGLAEFREHIGGELTITLLRALGQGEDVHEVNEDLMERVIRRVAAAG